MCISYIITQIRFYMYYMEQKQDYHIKKRVAPKRTTRFYKMKN